MSQKGIVVSIDFELDWGYTNSNDPLKSIEVFDGLNKLINIFKKHNIKTTWAIVGKLFENENENDSSKAQLNWIKNNLINSNLVEIGSHSYSHIFCEEVSSSVFEEDIEKMNIISKQNKIQFKSIVFPRNQFSQDNLIQLKKNNYTHYRGVLKRWFLKTNKYSNETFLKRNVIRFFELIPFKRDVIVSVSNGLVSISDSRFFRFFSTSFLGSFFSRFYYKVLKREMKKTIDRGNLYHIWFHPHNIIKKQNGFHELDDFLSCYNKILDQEKSVSSYKLSEIHI